MGLETNNDLSFPRKYRPTVFRDYVGNAKLKQQVMSALNTETKPQVILLYGPAGTGKTSMARLITMEYLCEHRTPEGGACGECYNCRMMKEFIKTGRCDALPNVKEVDVTDSNKKQDISDLLEDASQPSFDGNWKVYIMDECHAMGAAAQDRLLKELEEPAERVLMILCTTNPEKLKETIRTRCQYELQVKKPTQAELVGLLARVSKQEGIIGETKAFSLIATNSDYCPRKALTQLEKVASVKHTVTYENTVSVLDVIADKYFFTFYDILLAKYINTQKYISFIANLKDEMDLDYFVDSLVSFTLRGIYIFNGVLTDNLDVAELRQYKKIFGAFDVRDMSYLLDLLYSIKNSEDIELRLLMLGFKGIHRPNDVTTTDMKSKLLDVTQISATEEKLQGDKAYIKSKEITPEIKEKFIKDVNKPVSSSDLTNLFGATKVLMQ